MFVSSEASLDDLMRSTLHEVISKGQPIEPTKGPARELVGAVLELTDPRARLSRSETRSTAFSALGELLWYLSGSDEAAAISYYIKMYDDLAVAGRVEGAYGPRLRGDQDQLKQVIRALGDKKDTRQAVVQIFDRADNGNKLDVPCTCTLQFFVRQGHLDLVVYMRSNDAFLGLPHDVFCFTMIQEIVARSVGVELGRYVHMVGSLHVYERHLERCEEFLAEGWQGSAAMPPMPAGNPDVSVLGLLDAEASLRKNPNSAPDESQLENPYWGDLVAMLWAFRASNDGAPHLDQVAEFVDDEYFKIYLTERQLKVEGR